MSQVNLTEGLKLLDYLSTLGRQIISSWRAELFFQQDTPFIKDKKVKRQLELLAKNDLILPIKKGKRSLWRANTPYLHQINNIYELAGEAYPVGTLSYSSALEVLNLTDQRFNTIHISQPRVPVNNILGEPEEVRTNVIPPDTALEDWHINKAPKNVSLKKVWDTYTIASHEIKNEWIFGTKIREVEGVNVRITSIERTLIDGLKRPDYSGGLNEVFKAWVRALPHIDMDQIVDYTEKYDRSILYQRVGYVCETLGLTHEKFARWKQHNAPRRGSRLLNPYKDFANTYDPGWNISINHPVSILENKDADYS
jgi:predicted transcriptional regulator of viral defense system